MRTPADDNLAQVMLPGVAQDGFIFCLFGQGGGFGPQLLRQTQGAENGAALVLRQTVQLRRLDVDSVPDAAKLRRQTRGGAHQFLVTAAVADAEQDGVAGMPHLLLALTVAPGPHLIVHPVGGTAQGQLAQGDQIAFTEEVLDRPLGLPSDVNLTFVQALAQIVRGQIHQHHFICRVEEGIRDRLPYLDAGDAAHHVVKAFQMLHVDGGKDINARFQQLFNVLPAFGVTRAGGVAVRQLVHQDQCRTAGEGGVQIEFRHQTTTMMNTPGRLGRQPGQQGGGLLATVGFRHADQNIKPLGAQTLRFTEHGEGLADPRAGAEKDFQLAAMGGGSLLQQFVRVRALRLVDHLVFP